MKKMVKIAFGAVIGLLVMSGCGTSNVATDNAEINTALDGAPEWVMGDTGNTLSASGSAKIKNGNISFAVTQAEADARSKIAGQISTQVESKLRTLTTSTSDSVSEETVQAIRQSVSKVIPGSKSTKKWISKTNDMWVLVEVKELDTKLLEKNLMKVDGVDKEAAKALAKSVDELIDGAKND